MVVDFYDTENSSQFLLFDVVRAESENSSKRGKFLFGTDKNIPKNPLGIAIFAFFG